MEEHTTPEQGTSIGWFYEVDNYTLYDEGRVLGGPLAGSMQTITITAPQSPENDADIQTIVNALRRIAVRLEAIP